MSNQPPRPARILIPSTITVISVFLGYLSILYTFEGYYVSAAWLIVVAGVLDLFDGRLARMVGGTSKFGGYFDSLADAINYGVAPSLLFYRAYFSDWGLAGAALCFLPTLCGAIRLARFNVISEETGKSDFFVGLPTTVAAGFLASYVIFAAGGAADLWIAGGVLLTASLLMVSAVPYEHNSVFTNRALHRNWKAMLLLVALATIMLFPTEALFGWLLAYVLYGLTRGAVLAVSSQRKAM